jgi:hypothetical protein
MDSKKKRTTKPKSTTPNTTMSTKETIHQLIDDMDLQYTSEIEQLEHTKKDLLVQLEESRLSALENFKQYESTVQQVRSELDKTKLDSLEKSNDYESKIKQLQTEIEEYKTKKDKDIGCFKDVSILNQYLKEIYNLKNENAILTKRFDSTKKLLEQSQAENKYFKTLKKELSLVNHSETISHDSIEEVEELDVEEAATIEEKKEEVEEEELAQVEKKEDELEEIDVSKLDIIEVDDVEYYLDLDNQIRDKESLEVVGKVTDDGDAVFN